MTAVGAILQPMRRLGEVAPIILKGVAAADSVFTLVDQAPERDTGTYETARINGAVSFKNVSFFYNADNAMPALSDINLDVNPGEVVALVGRSGSGKSTLVNLIARFYDFQQGDILIDDVPINDFKLHNLREQIALVNQHVILFNDTVAANIAYGALETTHPDTIQRAADAAYASEFIAQLPLGFDTLIGESGARLSGGQRQRLAIARAILKNAPILILDEATSALDNESERYIQSALESVMKGRTTFVVAHRLSTIERADKIIVMAEGRIVEQGKHQDLLAKNGHYARLHASQFQDEETLDNDNLTAESDA
jgi:subfamily B ATP-binding cassette protein MsbA